MDASLAKILDGLDTRLALGEIDMATYNSLKAKFQAQAQGSAAGGDPLGGVVDGIRQEAAALKCPGCMAPLPPPADPSATTVTCEYCNGTFVIQKAEAEMEKLRGDVRKWISEVAGKGGGGSGDAASRSYIFRNSIFPGLKTAVERATELYQPIRYLPVFSFPLIDRLDRSPFKEALGLTPESRQLSESLKGIVSQVQAPELQPFAAGGRERADLKLLEVGCMELVHLSNVRHGLSSYSVDGFQRIVANTKALKEMYGGSADLLKSDDPAIAAFMSALVQRLDAVETAAETLESLLKSSDGVAVDPLVQRLDQAVIKCEAAASAFEASGREPKDTVPAAEGARNDATSIRILSASVKLFGDSVAAESGVPFADFLASLAQTIDAAAPSGAGLEWLDVYLGNLASYLGAMEGKVEVPVMDDFSWAQAKAEAGAKASLFGGKEEVRLADRLLVPFWMAVIQFAEQSGALFWKKGQAAEGFFFCDASRPCGACVIEPGTTAFAASAQAAVDSPRSLGGSTRVVAPALGADAALRAMKNAANQTEKYHGCHIKMVGIIYLPVATVAYVGKKGERIEHSLPTETPIDLGLTIRNVKLGNRDVLSAS
jgi:hypothetical protein